MNLGVLLIRFNGVLDDFAIVEPLDQVLVLRLSQQVDCPCRLNHQLDMLRLEIQALVAFLVVAEELVNNLLQTDFEQELV